MSGIESHPFEPFLPADARLLMLGTFPPAEKRWSVKFYYPNYQNDMWRIFGLCYYGDKTHFLIEGERRFNLNLIIPFLREHRIAMYDTATRIRRTKDTASDKDLEIIEQADFDGILRRLLCCTTVITAGQLATTVFCHHYNIGEPKVGCHSEFKFDGRDLRLYRMPSSSRAYPLAVERKAEIYEQVFKTIR